MQPALTTVDLPVLGMTCAACVRRVEKAVASVPGVASADVNLALSRARIELDPSRATADLAVAAIRDAGYEVPADVLDATSTGASRLAAIEDAAREDTQRLRRDAIVALVLTVPLLAIAMTHALSGVPIVIAQLVLGSLVVLGPGARYFRAGLSAVRHKSPDMNTLIALGAGAAWLSSTVTAVRWLAAADAQHHMPPLYFEAGAAIIAFVMIGKLLEARARSRLADAVRGVLSLAPTIAHLPDGRDVDAASLEAGTSIVVRPGERIPADGTIIEGTSAVDEALLTGESLPVDKSEGAPAYAGTLNHHGALTIRVARAGSDTALARIARVVEDSQGAKAPIARLADRVSAVFVPIVLGIAALTFVVWALAFDPSTALERAIAVLVIACPCALGLATPAAVAVGTARGAELGILFRSGAAIERGAHIDIVALDKTGTLTANTPTVTRVAGHNRTGDEVLRLAASAEQSSEHPIARALVAGAAHLTLSTPTNVVAEPGRGVIATVDGHRVRVGSRDALAIAGIDPSPIDHAAPSGATICYVAIDDELAGLIAVSDPPSPDAKRAIDALHAMGIEPVMLTGDRGEVADPLAREVGIGRVYANLAPTQKATLVHALREGRASSTDRSGPHSPVAMVGDGINDAPALAAADLGVALASGTDIAAAAADVTLLRGGLASLPTALALARATMRTIRTNLVAAFVYNAICIPIAAGALYPITGWLLSPVIASAAMSLSSVSVLASSLRLRSFAAQ